MLKENISLRAILPMFCHLQHRSISRLKCNFIKEGLYFFITVKGNARVYKKYGHTDIILRNLKKLVKKVDNI